MVVTNVPLSTSRPRETALGGARGAEAGAVGGLTVRVPWDGTLTVPVLPTTWIPRERLDRTLTEALRKRLTIITGLPGSGKTVLMAAWALHHADRRVAWVSLDDVGSDVERFRGALALALGRYLGHGEPGPVHEAAGGEPAGALDVSPGAPLGAAGLGVSLRSIVRLASRLPDAVLVLDDCHAATDPAITAEIVDLVRYLPPQLHVVLASREDPNLSLHRLRLAGELVEIRETDLRFRFDEAASLLEKVSGRPVGRRSVELLLQRTEGWAAGLHLAALMVREEGDSEECVERFAGDNQFVAEYLVNEVLNRLPDDLVQFLLLTSVLEELTGPLCERVSGLSATGAILDELVSRNLFVVRLDTSHTRFRYHRLFAELLRHSLHLRDPAATRRAHRRAGAWFAEAGDVGRAVDHFLAGADFDRAFSAIGTALVADLEAGRDPSWQAEKATRLPDEFVLGNPVRTYVLASAALFGGHLGDGDLWLYRLERAGETLGAADRAEAARWGLRLESLWALREAVAGHLEAVVLHDRRAAVSAAGLRGPTPVGSTAASNGSSARGGPAPSRHVRGPGLLVARLDGLVAAALALAAARAHSWLGDHAAARRRLASLGASSGVSCEPVDTVGVPGLLALVAIDEGRLSEAAALAGAALETARRSGIDMAAVTVDARVALGRVSLERNELGQAEAQLQAAAALCSRVGRPVWAAVVELEMVPMFLAASKHPRALEMLARLRRGVGDLELPACFAGRLEEATIRCCIAAGEIERALETWRAMAPDQRPANLGARLEISAGRPDRAGAVLAASREAGHLFGQELERLVLVARALLQAGAPRRARNALLLAVEKARPEGHVRVLAEFAGAFDPLLEGMRSEVPDPLLDALVAPDGLSGSGREPPPELVLIEGLTERERVALAQLPSHLTQQQIASAMFVSVNTLKTHLKALYRKLGASSRSDAVTIARRHGLL